MMLTKDKLEPKPKGKNKPPPKVKEKGTRTLAGEFFSDASFNNIRAQLMNATVRIRRKNAPFNTASGVILSAPQAQPRKAYILTAKHALYFLANEKDKRAKPSDYNTKDFCDSIEIGYAPNALLALPAQTAAVTGISFWLQNVCDPNKWEYDIVILESTDANFINHVQANRFLSQQTRPDYVKVMKTTNAGDYVILKKELFEFFQLGYGTARVKNVGNSQDYVDYEGKLQIKKSEPKVAQPKDSVFEIEGEDESKWPLNDQICVMNANKNDSTGGGDSGGPLFCRPKKVDQTESYLNSKDKFYLVGVTAGANFFTDEVYRADKTKRPTANDIHNNAVTFFGDVFKAQ